MGRPSSQDLAPFRRPIDIPFPKDNVYSSDRAALGKALFFDPRVSGNGNITCMACHNPSFAWSDGQAKAVGAQAKTCLAILPRSLTWLGKSIFSGTGVLRR